MALGYQQYVNQIALLAVVDPADSNFLLAVPSMISYAELRIQRDLDLMQASVSLRGSGYKLNAGNRNISFPMTLSDGSSFIVSEQINIILPIGNNDPDNGERVPLLPVTKEYLDTVCSSALPENLAQPMYFTAFNETLFMVGPVPNADYFVEVVGMIRLPSMADTHDATFISQFFPDMFIMASMIYLSGYQRNFGAQSGDPAMAVSYESQYTALLQGSIVEESRKNYMAAAWSSMPPAVVASPSRSK